MAFVFVALFVFLANVSAFYFGGFLNREQASLSTFFVFHPYLFILFIVFMPALDMRLWAEADSWTIKEADFFPAKTPTAKRLINGLRAMTFVEPRTRLVEHHARLDLEDPGDGGDEIRLTAYDRDGKVAVGLMMGKSQLASTPGRPGTLFVRKLPDPRIWLAEGELNIAPQVCQWLDRGFDLPDEESILSVQIKPLKRPPVSWTATRRSVRWVAKTPKKFAKSRFEELARPARAFSLLVIEGALESGQVKFGKTDTAVFRTNDGLILTARHAVADARHWITIATGDPDILNRRTAG